MDRLRFIHAADLHLDSPMIHLDRYDGAPVEAMRNATRAALDQLVDLAIAEQVSFVLVAGDLYDGDCRDFQTPMRVRRAMERLAERDIRTFVIQGNHDAESRVTRAFRLELPSHVHLFSTKRPETVTLDDVRVAVHGQGFATPAVNEDLSARFPPPVAGWFNIGLLHTSCGGWDGHGRYAPSTIEGLAARGYDYWALGHIHERRVLRDGDPWIVYPGNMQGRHVQESGPKGCSLVEVVDGHVERVDHRSVDVLRWATCSVVVDTCARPSEIIDHIEKAVTDEVAQVGDRLLAVRIVVTGAARVHQELVAHAPFWDDAVRERLVDRFPDRVWVEQIRFTTQPAGTITEVESTLTGGAAPPGADPVQSLVDEIVELAPRGDLSGAVDAAREDIEKLLGLLPSDPRAGEIAIRPRDEAWLTAEVEAVRALLLGHLIPSADVIDGADS